MVSAEDFNVPVPGLIGVLHHHGDGLEGDPEIVVGDNGAAEVCRRILLCAQLLLPEWKSAGECD